MESIRGLSCMSNYPIPKDDISAISLDHRYCTTQWHLKALTHMFPLDIGLQVVSRGEVYFRAWCYENIRPQLEYMIFVQDHGLWHTVQYENIVKNSHNDRRCNEWVFQRNKCAYMKKHSMTTMIKFASPKIGKALYEVHTDLFPCGCPNWQGLHQPDLLQVFMFGLLGHAALPENHWNIKFRGSHQNL